MANGSFFWGGGEEEKGRITTFASCIMSRGERQIISCYFSFFLDYYFAEREKKNLRVLISGKRDSHLLFM